MPTEYREERTQIYRNRLADLWVDDSRISARVARTFAPATRSLLPFTALLPDAGMYQDHFSFTFEVLPGFSQYR